MKDERKIQSEENEENGMAIRDLPSAIRYSL